MPDWIDAPYARVFATLPQDRPSLWLDDRLLAWYVRLLLPADRAWPTLLAWPRDLPEDVQTQLVQVGAVDAIGPAWYQIHGLARLRDADDRRHRAGGRARAAVAGRDAGGRMLAGPASAPASLTSAEYPAPERETPAPVTSAEQPAPSNGASVEALDAERWSKPLVPAVSPATHPAPSSDETNETIDDDAALTSVVVGREISPSGAGAREEPGDEVESGPLDPLTPTSRAAMVRAHGPDDAECDEPELHPLHHRYYVGVGWRCLLCERSDSRTLKERVGRYARQDF